MTQQTYPHLALPAHYGTEILRSEVGSTLYGTGLPGNEDRDEMGIYIEHPASVFGFRNCDHWVKRTAKEGERSTSTDVDLMMYSARKWASLALNGNPSVIALLFAPDGVLVSCDWWGRDLRNHAYWFASKRAGNAFLGYMEQQRQRMVGQRGRAGRVRVMPDGGVDWKYAMHMLRLGYQGVEFLKDGRLTLPVPGDLGDHLRAVRRGEVPFDRVVTESEGLEARVKSLLAETSPLPDEPDRKAVAKWLEAAHRETWEAATPTQPPPVVDNQ